MLKYVNTDIVFQEIPDEVTLAINLSGCPCRCPGCHSTHLWTDNGTPLTTEALDSLVAGYMPSLTCVSFMGGDAEPEAVDSLAAHIKKRFAGLRTAWYSGRTILAPAANVDHFDYIKLGPYLRHLGGLKSPRTNQRLYRIVAGKLNDITSRLQRTAL